MVFQLLPYYGVWLLVFLAFLWKSETPLQRSLRIAATAVFGSGMIAAGYYAWRGIDILTYLYLLNWAASIVGVTASLAFLYLLTMIELGRCDGRQSHWLEPWRQGRYLPCIPLSPMRKRPKRSSQPRTRSTQGPLQGARRHCCWTYFRALGRSRGASPSRRLRCSIGRTAQQCASMNGHGRWPGSAATRTETRSQAFYTSRPVTARRRLSPSRFTAAPRSSRPGDARNEAHVDVPDCPLFRRDQRVAHIA